MKVVVLFIFVWFDVSLIVADVFSGCSFVVVVIEDVLVCFFVYDIV